MTDGQQKESGKSARGILRNLDRMNGFSDGVFAVAITLLVLSIKVPDVPADKLGSALADLWPHFLAYGLSFVIIGLFWMAHHGLFRQLDRFNAVYMRFNLLFLMVIVFMPYPTNLISLYNNSEVATVLYAATISAAAVILSLMCFYAIWNNRLIESVYHKEIARDIGMSFAGIAVVFAISIGVAYINNSAAQYLWLAVIPINILSGFLTRKISREPEELVEVP